MARPVATAAAKQHRNRSTFSAPMVGHAPVHVLTVTLVVTAGGGRQRALLPWLCACGQRHISQARGQLPATLSRRGPHGPIVLHIARPTTPHLWSVDSHDEGVAT